MRLLKQRRALTVEIMFAITVMDKSTKLSGRVKYPTGKRSPARRWLEPRGLTEKMGV